MHIFWHTFLLAGSTYVSCYDASEERGAKVLPEWLPRTYVNYLYQDQASRQNNHNLQTMLQNSPTKGIGRKLSSKLRDAFDVITSIFQKKPPKTKVIIMPSNNDPQMMLFKKKTTKKPMPVVTKPRVTPAPKPPPKIGWIISSFGMIPEAAVSAGIDRGRRVIVARSRKFGRIPGTLREGDICVRFEMNGRMYCQRNYEVLCGHKYYWYRKPWPGAKLHSDTEIGGWINYKELGVKGTWPNGKQTICRTWFRNHLHVGRAFLGNYSKCMFASTEGLSISNAYYDQLLHSIV